MTPDSQDSSPDDTPPRRPSRRRGLFRGPRAGRLRQAFNPFEGIPPPLPRRTPGPHPDTSLEEPVTPAQERAMRNLWWDGFFAEASETIWLGYLTVYALTFGAAEGFVGVMAAVGAVVAALSMWPGAVLAERTRRYRWIVLLTGGGPGRVLILAMVALPWMASDKAALGVLLAVSLGRAFLGNVAMPAWSAFGAEFVPLGLRGRYFGSRNFARQVAGLIVAPLAGLLIERVGGVEGWQIAWVVAFILGATATGFYARIPEEAADPGLRAMTDRPEPPSEPRAFLKDSNLMWLTGTVGLFHTSVMLAGPFFSVYLVRHLGASALWVGITAAAVPVGGLIAQPLVGQINDRLGAKWLLVVSGFFLPALPWLWAIVTEPWHVIFINVAAGAFWSAHQLGTFNLTLAIAPPEKRATYSAVQQGAVFVAGAIGPLIGGPVIGLAGYKLIFLLSGAGRVVATALLMRTVRDRARSPATGSRG